MSGAVNVVKDKQLSLFLYRSLLRKCSYIDKNSKIKSKVVTPSTLTNQLPRFFLPSVSFTANLRHVFRLYANHDLTPIEVTTAISDGFMLLRNLNAAITSHTKKETSIQKNENELDDIIKSLDKDARSMGLSPKELKLTIKSVPGMKDLANFVIAKTKLLKPEQLKPTPITTDPLSTSGYSNEYENDEDGEYQDDDDEQDMEATKSEIEDEFKKLQSIRTRLAKNYPLQNMNRKFDIESTATENKNHNIKEIEAKQNDTTQEKEEIIGENEVVEDDSGKTIKNYWWPVESTKEIKAGSLLVSHPSLESVFHKSVVLITHTSNDRHYGYIINRPVPTSPVMRRLQEKFEQENTISDRPISRNLLKHYKFSQKRPLSPYTKAPWFCGGPVPIHQYEMVKGVDGLENTQIIHSHKDIKGAIMIRDGIYMGGDFKEIGDKIKNKEIQAESIMMVVGCSVWKPGQLRGEIEDGAWFHAECNDINNLSKDESMWREALQSMGGDYKELAK